MQAADLVETLQSKGPFTVFAPTNTAFARIPRSTLAGLLEPESKDQLTNILTYHVVPGKITSEQVLKAIKAGFGKAALTTVQGGTLTASLEGENVILTDEKGGRSVVTNTDVQAANGVIHIIDSVIMPELRNTSGHKRSSCTGKKSYGSW